MEGGHNPRGMEGLHSGYPSTHVRITVAADEQMLRGLQSTSPYANLLRTWYATRSLKWPSHVQFPLLQFTIALRQAAPDFAGLTK